MEKKVKLEVNMKEETVWLSLDQMAQLFDRDKSVISRHIKNVIKGWSGCCKICNNH